MFSTSSISLYSIPLYVFCLATVILVSVVGEDGATLEGAIKLTKFAFCFEQWEVFEALNEAVLAYLGVSDRNCQVFIQPSSFVYWI